MAAMEQAQEQTQPNKADERQTSQAETAKAANAVSVKQTASGGERQTHLDFMLDIPLEITVELGRTHMVINDLLKLGQGSVIELLKSAGETLEIRANQKLIARGEVVVVNDKYGIRLTEIVSPMERVEKLK